MTLRTKGPTNVTSARWCTTARSTVSSSRTRGTFHTTKSCLGGNTGQWMRAGSALSAGWGGSTSTLRRAQEKQSAFLPHRFPRRFVTTASISTPADGASVTTVNPIAPAAPGIIFQAASSTPRTTPFRVRLRFEGDASPHCTTGKTSGGVGHGTPHSSAGRALSRSGNAHPRRSSNGWSCTILAPKRQHRSTGGGSPALHDRAATADGTGPTEAVGGRRTRKAGSDVSCARVHMSLRTVGRTVFPPLLHFRFRATDANGAFDSNLTYVTPLQPNGASDAMMKQVGLERSHTPEVMPAQRSPKGLLTKVPSVTRLALAVLTQTHK